MPGGDPGFLEKAGNIDAVFADVPGQQVLEPSGRIWTSLARYPVRRRILECHLAECTGRLLRRHLSLTCILWVLWRAADAHGVQCGWARGNMTPMASLRTQARNRRRQADVNLLTRAARIAVDFRQPFFRRTTASLIARGMMLRLLALDGRPAPAWLAQFVPPHIWGRYCGPGAVGPGTPVDCLDAACATHDRELAEADYLDAEADFIDRWSFDAVLEPGRDTQMFVPVLATPFVFNGHAWVRVSVAFVLEPGEVAVLHPSGLFINGTFRWTARPGQAMRVLLSAT